LNLITGPLLEPASINARRMWFFASFKNKEQQ